MTISQSVRDAWHLNDGMNEVLLEHVTPDLLGVQTPDESWSVAGYLAHMAGSKKWWGTHLNEEADRLPDLYEDIEGKFIVEKNLETIKAVFAQTSQTLLETAERADTLRLSRPLSHAHDHP